MNKIIGHIKTWNRWRKSNTNSKFHKFLVLIGFIKSPTFYLACVEVPSMENLMDEPEIKPLTRRRWFKIRKIVVCDEIHNYKDERIAQAIKEGMEEEKNDQRRDS